MSIIASKSWEMKSWHVEASHTKKVTLVGTQTAPAIDASLEVMKMKRDLEM